MICKFEPFNFANQISRNLQEIVYFVDDKEEENKNITKNIEKLSKDFPFIKVLKFEWEEFYKYNNYSYCENSSCVLKIDMGEITCIKDTSEENLKSIFEEFSIKQKSGPVKRVKVPRANYYFSKPAYFLPITNKSFTSSQIEMIRNKYGNKKYGDKKDSQPENKIELQPKNQPKMLERKKQRGKNYKGT